MGSLEKWLVERNEERQGRWRGGGIKTDKIATAATNTTTTTMTVFFNVLFEKSLKSRILYFLLGTSKNLILLYKKLY